VGLTVRSLQKTRQKLKDETHTTGARDRCFPSDNPKASYFFWTQQKIVHTENGEKNLSTEFDIPDTEQDSNKSTARLQKGPERIPMKGDKWCNSHHSIRRLENSAREMGFQGVGARLSFKSADWRSDDRPTITTGVNGGRPGPDEN